MLMTRWQVHRVFVVGGKQRKLKGIVSVHDILTALVDRMAE